MNADECKWQLNENDEIVKMLKKDTRKCGKKISTKAVGTFKRLDVTNLYKFDEGLCFELIFGKVRTYVKYAQKLVKVRIISKSLQEIRCHQFVQVR